MAGNVEIGHGQTYMKFGGILGAVTLAVIVLGFGLAAVFYQNAKILEMVGDARILQAEIAKRQVRINTTVTEMSRDLTFVLGSMFPRDRPPTALPRHHSE